MEGRKIKRKFALFATSLLTAMLSTTLIVPTTQALALPSNNDIDDDSLSNLAEVELESDGTKEWRINLNSWPKMYPGASREAITKAEWYIR